jgi:DNA topoisomerase II
VSYTDGVLEVENDGESIDVAKHPEHDMYIPQLIFGELLTSTNYDKDEKKLVGGKNGYGVKLVNIFAKQLQVSSIVDPVRALRYDQTFHDNMTRADPPKVKASKGKASVSAAVVPGLCAVRLYGGSPAGGHGPSHRAARLRPGHDRREGGQGQLEWSRSSSAAASRIMPSPSAARLSFTRAQMIGGRSSSPPLQGWVLPLVLRQRHLDVSKGGKHVDAVTDQVVGHITDYLETKKKCKTKPSTVKEHLGVFLVSLIENPSFSSQTKETLTTKASAFGSSPKLSEDTLKKIVSKLGIVEQILEVTGGEGQRRTTARRMERSRAGSRAFPSSTMR